MRLPARPPAAKQWAHRLLNVEELAFPSPVRVPPSLSVQPTIQVNRTCGRGDGLSPEMISLGGQAQLCKPAVYSSKKGQAAIENSPAQLPPRQRHPSVFASCGLSPPDSGAGSAFGPEK